MSNKSKENDELRDLPWTFPVKPTISNAQDVNRELMYDEEVKNFSWLDNHGRTPQRGSVCTNS